ncbi:MAG: cellulose synthase operon protein YhjQ/BcsQ, partial [Planctomycetota bacterium]
EVAGWYQPEDLSPMEQVSVEQSTLHKPDLAFEPPEAIYDPHSEFKVKDYNPDEEFGSGKTIAQTEFEASVVDSLGLPQVHTQYEQIWSAMRNGQPLKSPQIIGVVTTEPELHVAAVLSHLAIMISYEMGRHVLLVDGDARQRALTNAMELEDMRGFNETCNLECGWREAVIPTSHNKLCILPAGNLSINSTQIESLFLPTMANEWREMFDVVFVDIGDAQAPMARPLYKMCDKTYLLVRLGHTSREFADEIADQLADDGVNLTGCIVTNLP